MAGHALAHVRAAAPEPGATATFGDHWVEILAAERCRATAPAGLRPAEAWLTDAGWAVCCGEGAVIVRRARDEEGEPVDLDALFASVAR